MRASTTERAQASRVVAVCAVLLAVATTASGVERRVAVVVTPGRDAYAAAATALVNTLELSAKPRVTCSRFELQRTSRDVAGSGDVLERLSAFEPEVVAAVGADASQWALTYVPALPVVTCMTLDAPQVRKTGPQGGTHLRIEPTLRMRLIAEALGTEHKCGVLYDASTSSELVAGFLAAAKAVNVDLAIMPAKAAADVRKAFAGLLGGGCSVVIGLADSRLYTKASATLILRECLRHRVVFVGISPAFARAGAMLALYTDPSDQGTQLGKMALEYLRAPDTGLLYVPPERVRVALNVSVARIVKARIDAKFMQKVDLRFGR